MFGRFGLFRTLDFSKEQGLTKNFDNYYYDEKTYYRKKKLIDIGICVSLYTDIGITSGRFVSDIGLFEVANPCQSTFDTNIDVDKHVDNRTISLF